MLLRIVRCGNGGVLKHITELKWVRFSPLQKFNSELSKNFRKLYRCNHWYKIVAVPVQIETFIDSSISISRFLVHVFCGGSKH